MQQLSPIFIGVISVAVLFLIGLFLMDRRRTRSSNHIASLMKAFVLKHAMRPISVVITTESWDERIWDTLQHLESLQYEELQIIIIAGPEIDKPVVSKLRKYQRAKRSSLTMTIAQRRMNATERSVILRYVKGDAILWLRPGETVSENCFRRISVELLNESANSFSIREFPRVNDSLRSATLALDVIASRLLFKTQRNVRIVRTASFRNNSAESPTAIEDASVVTPYYSRTGASGLAIGLLILVTAGVGIAAAVLLPSGAQLLISSLYGVGLLLVALSTLSSPYRNSVKGPLVMLLPLWPILSVLDSLRFIVKRVIRKLRPKASGAQTAKNPAR